MTSRRRSHPFRVLLVALVFALGAVVWWLDQGRLVDVGEAAGARVQCMSYAPFRKPGESPLVAGTWIDEARLREDLGLLAPRTDCVRTYSVQQGLEMVPAVARSLGMKVLLGVWLGRNRAENEAELQKAIGLARQYPETVAALVIGNEVLLRRELPESAIAAYLDRARAGGVPVTYADVWEFWSVHEGLARHVDFVTVHILPYWEDHPVGIDEAVPHIVATAEAMRHRFAGKEILIGETGWPSAGRPRREAVASLVNQAKFFRAFSVAARDHGFRYNFIEAFDQPWKRRLEGAMGGSWGLFSSAGEAKFPSTGPVRESAGYRRGLIGAALGAGLLAGWIGIAARRRPDAAGPATGDGFGIMLAAAAGAAWGALTVALWDYLWVWNRTVDEWAAALLAAAVAVLMPVLALPIVRDAVRPGVGRPEIPPVASVVRRWRGQHQGGGRLYRGRLYREDVFGLLRFAMLFALAVTMVLLAFDPRYRGFPVALYLLPLLAFLMLGLAGVRLTRLGIEEAALTMIALVCALLVIPIERLSNTLAMVFVAEVVLLLGVATGFRYGRRLQQDRLTDVPAADRRSTNRAGA